METCPREGVVKEEKFPNTRKLSHRQVRGEFWNLGGQHNREGKKKKPQITHLATTPSKEVAQTLESASSEGRLNGDPLAALLRVRTRPECPADNLRELT